MILQRLMFPASHPQPQSPNPGFPIRFCLTASDLVFKAARQSLQQKAARQSLQQKVARQSLQQKVARQSLQQKAARQSLQQKAWVQSYLLIHHCLYCMQWKLWVWEARTRECSRTFWIEECQEALGHAQNILWKEEYFTMTNILYKERGMFCNNAQTHL